MRFPFSDFLASEIFPDVLGEKQRQIIGRIIKHRINNIFFNLPKTY
jgi:hypothetical protein